MGSRRSSTLISTLVCIPCRRSWRAVISPLASRRWTSTAPERGTSHAGAESESPRDGSRTAGGETARAEGYAGCHRSGGDCCAYRNRQHIELGQWQQENSAGERDANASIRAQRATGDELRDTAAITGQTRRGGWT